MASLASAPWQRSPGGMRLEASHGSVRWAGWLGRMRLANCPRRITAPQGALGGVRSAQRASLMDITKCTQSPTHPHPAKRFPQARSTKRSQNAICEAHSAATHSAKGTPPSKIRSNSPPFAHPAKRFPPNAQGGKLDKTHIAWWEWPSQGALGGLCLAKRGTQHGQGGGRGRLGLGLRSALGE